MPDFEWTGGNSPAGGTSFNEGEGFTSENENGFDVQFTLIDEGPGFSSAHVETNFSGFTDVFDGGQSSGGDLGQTFLVLEGGGNANGNDTSTVEIAFWEEGSTATGTPIADEVAGVEFYVTDIDLNTWDDQVTIWAYDASGNALPIYLYPANSTAGDPPASSSTIDGDSLDETTPEDGYSLDAIGGAVDFDDAAGAVLVQIPGDVHRIVVNYGNTGPGGQWIAISEIAFNDNVVPCFTQGTLIETDKGPRSIDDLEIGDLVRTKDNGFQRIRWIGSTTVPANNKYGPIVISKDALGKHDELRVSPRHRILIDGWRADVLFGETEVLVSACHLKDGDKIYQATGGDVTYYHMLFDDHQIIYSNGVETESLHPGKCAFKGLPKESRQEILELFPELKEELGTYGPLARRELQRYEADLVQKSVRS